MPRFSGTKGKLVRRLGVNIFENPKYDKLLAKRPTPPGIHGSSGVRRRVSEYGRQLLEKQKLRFAYGLREKQFKKLFDKAHNMEGVTGDNLLSLLESRLDNAVFRAGMAPTREAARQLVSHGHIMVNGRRVNVPSYKIKKGEVITPKDRTSSKNLVAKNLQESNLRPAPEWMNVDVKKAEATVLRSPFGSEVQSVADLQMIVELYSR